jgi:WD40 repeat protein
MGWAGFFGWPMKAQARRPLLASASHDGTVRLWDAATGICLQALEGRMKLIAFNPDGPNLVTDIGVLGVRQIPQSNHSPKWIGYCSPSPADYPF